MAVVGTRMVKRTLSKKKKKKKKKCADLVHGDGIGGSLAGDGVGGAHGQVGLARHATREPEVPVQPVPAPGRNGGKKTHFFN